MSVASIAQRPAIGVRWTIGDVSEYGWQALRLSMLGALRVFGPDAAYAVCVNSVSLSEARTRVGEIPSGVTWQAVSRADLPAVLRKHLDDGMAEGVAWKLAPLRVFPNRWEISLDNDCILWSLPSAIRAWLAEDNPRRCLLAEDVRAMYGQFAHVCEPAPRNAGIRGVSPGYPLEHAIARLVRDMPDLVSELDEQGLQVAAVSAFESPAVVSIDDVTICSPFPPHSSELGRCGAHFCGLNVRHFPWARDGRNAEDWIRENWRRHLHTIRRQVHDFRPE
jgi:hypothetical protein